MIRIIINNISRNLFINLIKSKIINNIIFIINISRCVNYIIILYIKGFFYYILRHFYYIIQLLIIKLFIKLLIIISR